MAMGRDLPPMTSRQRLSESGDAEMMQQQQYEPMPRWSLPSINQSHDAPSTLPLLERELEMELEASDNTLRRQEEEAMRVSEVQNPFSSSKLQPFHQMSEEAVDATARLYRTRVERQKQFVNAFQAANINGKPTRTPKAMSMTGAFDPRLTNDDQWKFVKEHADVRVYRHAQRRGKTTSMMAQGMIRGSLAEIMDGLYAETTKEARVLYALLSDKFLDASVLHVDSYRTAQHPFQFAGVTWMAVETPRGYGMCSDRDFLCFKKMGTIRDPECSGDDVGFLTLLSVDQSEAASAHFLRASATNPDFVRGFLSLTVFFKPLPNGLISMFVQGDFNARGHLASRLADAMFADLVFAFANAAKCGQAKSLALLLQSISTGQLPPGGVTGSTSTVSHYLLPLLSERNRDRCGVCSKTLWKMLESPEFCRSCWTRTCRTCRVTMPIYCADFHRAHDEDFHFGGPLSRKKYKRLPRPCKETFCLKCVCSVLPNGIKMNAKLIKQTAKKKKRNKRFAASGSVVTDPSLMRRGVGGPSSRRMYSSHAPSVVHSMASRSGKSRHGGSGDSTSAREPGKVYVQIPSRSHHHHHHHRSRVAAAATATSAMATPPTAAHFDDHSSISHLSSAESEKLQRQRLSLSKSSGPKPATPAIWTPLQAQVSKPQAGQAQLQSKPGSMLEVLENYQLDATSMDDGTYSAAGLSLKSYSTGSGDGAPISFYPVDPQPLQPLNPTRKLQLRVSLTPRKRGRRSSTASSSKNGGGSASSPNSSRKTNYAASSSKQSPNSKQQLFGDEYYNQVLQRYLENRRTSIGLTSSSTMSGDQLPDGAAAAAASAAPSTPSYASAAGLSSSSSGDGGHRKDSGDSRKMRILRDLQPGSYTRASYRDHTLSPLRLSMSSFSSVSASSVSDHFGVDSLTSSKHSQDEWAPPAY